MGGQGGCVAGWGWSLGRAGGDDRVGRRVGGHCWEVRPWSCSASQRGCAGSPCRPAPSFPPLRLPLPSRPTGLPAGAGAGQGGGTQRQQGAAGAGCCYWGLRGGPTGVRAALRFCLRFRWPHSGLPVCVIASAHCRHTRTTPAYVRMPARRTMWRGRSSGLPRGCRRRSARTAPSTCR